MNDLFIVVELQHDGDQIANIVADYASENTAYYNFHYASAFAAISDIDKHSVSLLNEEGGIIDRASFTHVEEPEEITPKYIVIEYQINNDMPSRIVTTHDTLQDAQYKFHTTAAAAVTSNVDTHLVVALNDDGFPIEYAIFKH